MPTNNELRSMQKRSLHQLLMIKKNQEKLDEYINVTKTEMDAEDVAYVEKMIKELEESAESK